MASFVCKEFEIPHTQILLDKDQVFPYVTFTMKRYFKKAHCMISMVCESHSSLKEYKVLFFSGKQLDSIQELRSHVNEDIILKKHFLS